MSVVTTCYVLMSAALTLMVPYDKVHRTAAFSDAFEQRHLPWAKWLVSVGTTFGYNSHVVKCMCMCLVDVL